MLPVSVPAYSTRHRRHRRSRMTIGPPRSRLRRLFAQQQGLCIYCNTQMVLHHAVWGEPIPPNAATRDHVIPRAQGGKQLKNNVVAACSACNLSRGTEPWSTFLARTAPTLSHFLKASQYMELRVCTAPLACCWDGSTTTCPSTTKATDIS